MTIILPYKNAQLEEVISKINSDVLKEIFSKSYGFGIVNIHLPKFKIEHKIEVIYTNSYLFLTLYFECFFI